MNGLKYIREEVMGMSLNELAEVLGLSKQAVYSWEIGRKKIPEKRLKQLKDISGIPEKYFLIQEVTEKDELIIEQHRLNKVLDESVIRYDEIKRDGEVEPRTYVDSGIVTALKFNEMDLKIHELQEEMAAVINEYQPDIVDGEDMTMEGDILNSINRKCNEFKRFINIVKQDRYMENVPPVIGAVERYHKKQPLSEAAENFLANTEINGLSLEELIYACMLLFDKEVDEGGN